jgi:hypothetical protein
LAGIKETKIVSISARKIILSSSLSLQHDLKTELLNFVSNMESPVHRLLKPVPAVTRIPRVQFVETEESYTSKTSFLDGDYLPTIGEKPQDWKPSGKRTKRGLYRTAINWYINADGNGAANILRKGCDSFVGEYITNGENDKDRTLKIS